MTIRGTFLLILPACVLLMPPLSHGDDLGRLFTTPEQRKQLDELRYRKEVVVDVPDIEPVPEPEAGRVELVDPITVRGVVYRQGGHNTAWINEANTFTGDMETQYLKVDPADIDRGYIYITLPDAESKLRLRVGESYEPASGETHDVIEAD